MAIKITQYWILPKDNGEKTCRIKSVPFIIKKDHPRYKEFRLMCENPKKVLSFIRSRPKKFPTKSKYIKVGDKNVVLMYNCHLWGREKGKKKGDNAVFFPVDIRNDKKLPVYPYGDVRKGRSYLDG